MARRPDPTPAQPVPTLHRHVPQHLVRRLWQVAATFQSEALGPFDLAPWHVALLSQLRDTPGMDRNWLAGAIGRDATSTGQALADFEARRLVARSRNEVDRRANAFALTEAGQDLMARLGEPVRRVAHRILSPLTEAEAETLLELLARLVEAHEPHARPGAGRRPPRRAGREGESACPQTPVSSAAEPPSASASPAPPAPRARKAGRPGPTARSA